MGSVAEGGPKYGSPSHTIVFVLRSQDPSQGIGAESSQQ